MTGGWRRYPPLYALRLLISNYHSRAPYPVEVAYLAQHRLRPVQARAMLFPCVRTRGRCAAHSPVARTSGSGLPRCCGRSAPLLGKPTAAAHRQLRSRPRDRCVPMAACAQHRRSWALASSSCLREDPSSLSGVRSSEADLVRPRPPRSPSRSSAAAGEHALDERGTFASVGFSAMVH